MQSAFHLRRLHPVRVRFARSGAGAVLLAEARLQAGACLPGVAAVLEKGALDEERVFVAIEPGAALDSLLTGRERRLQRKDVLALALAGVRILRALGLAGITLPDVHPRRFTLRRPDDWHSLVLADFQGAMKAESQQAVEAAAGLARAWCRAALSFPPFRGDEPRRDLPVSLKQELGDAFERGAAPAALAALLLQDATWAE